MTDDVGKVFSVNDEEELDIWDDEVGSCNVMNGTDGYLFPPFRPKTTPIQAYERALCRTFYIPFEKKIYYKGISTHMFTYDLGDIQNEPENRCYCREEDQCPLKGTMDLFPCVGAPLTISMPHFYNADPSLLEKIAEGLYPDKQKHQIFLKTDLVSRLKLHFCSLTHSVNCHTANGSASVSSKTWSAKF